MKKLAASALLALLCAGAVLIGVRMYANAAMPEYNYAVGYEYYPEKLKGTAIIGEASKTESNVFIFGSSELNTTMIASHPANFFAEYNMGFDLCLVGRGSCQSLIHAINVAGNAESLKGRKVVLISSPQHFIPMGIEPDMFVANFSEQQYMELLSNPELSSDIKSRISKRVTECFERYENEQGAVDGFEASRLAAELVSDNNPLNTLLKPYFATCRYLNNIKDDFTAARVMKQAESKHIEGIYTGFDWVRYKDEMAELGSAESDNNNFGILSDYYDTNIGKKLGRMEDKDADLSYSESVEYDDLELLMDVCRELELDVMYVHIPINGLWSDYTGFTADKRQEYYDKVTDIVSGYDVKLLDLTAHEYDSYYLCDVMHIGWTGWVDINEAIYKFYFKDK